MELKLKLSSKNEAMLGGILIKSDSVLHWLFEIQLMGLRLEAVDVYPLPQQTPNSVWGCVILCTNADFKNTSFRNHSYCQLVEQLLLIPEKTRLSPAVNPTELKKLLRNQKHLLHPEIGLVELTEPIYWQNHIALPRQQKIEIKEPVASVFIPSKIKSFQIKPIPPEEMLEALENKAFPKKEKPKDKPLNILEKAKLHFYKMAFKKPTKDVNKDGGLQKTPLMSMIESIKNFFGAKDSKWIENMEQDYEELEKRNQKAIDRLLDMLKNDPDEALKYAIPLDQDGASRGGNMGSLDLSMRWGDFSLFSRNQTSSSGGATMGADHFARLQEQYQKTAQELIAQKEYHKAAFVYMKLLKNYYLAAQTLENAHFYQEAASIYLKYVKNPLKAAECYEKGNMTLDAITHYKELQMHEKVGDLYMSIHHKKEAVMSYEIVVNNLINSSQYVKASQLYEHKLHDYTSAQQILLQGWAENKDAFNCLKTYFSNIDDPKTLNKDIDQLYEKTLTHNREIFLQVLKHEYQRHPELDARIKQIAYEIIAQHAHSNPSIVAELKTFNPDDPLLLKDTMRFKLNIKK